MEGQGEVLLLVCAVAVTDDLVVLRLWLAGDRGLNAESEYVQVA